jgi:hypothetical protein
MMMLKSTTQAVKIKGYRTLTAIEDRFSVSERIWQQALGAPLPQPCTAGHREPV